MRNQRGRCLWYNKWKKVLWNAVVSGKEEGALAPQGHENAHGVQSVMCELGIVMCGSTFGFNEQNKKQHINLFILSLNVKGPSGMQFLYWPPDISSNVCLGASSESYCSTEVILKQHELILSPLGGSRTSCIHNINTFTYDLLSRMCSQH